MGLLIVVMFATAILVGLFGPEIISFSRSLKAKREVKEITSKSLSWPAIELIKKNAELPIESQISDLDSVLAALDLKYGGIELVNDHYLRMRDYSTLKHGAWKHDDCYWSDGSFRRKCIMPEYLTIYTGIEDVLKAREAQKRAFEIESKRHDLSRVAEIESHLRSERDIVNSVTKEITG